jgi:L,D-transpeptidase catalytic domain
MRVSDSRRSLSIGFMVVLAACLIGMASAKVRIDVDLASQRMYVSGDRGDFTFPISSARRGYVTPRGSFRVKRLEPMHYSRKYDNSPMPHAMFFAGGYAIHGTGAVGQLGRPASHGCIRLSRGNAALLYDMVKKEGGRVSISGSPPTARLAAATRRARRAMIADRSLLVPSAYPLIRRPVWVIPRHQWLADEAW